MHRLQYRILSPKDYFFVSYPVKNQLLLQNAPQNSVNSLTAITLNSFLQAILATLIYLLGRVMGIKRGTMKFPYFKTMLAIGALLVAWNCSDDSAINYVNTLPATAEDVKVLITADGYLYITESGDVKDAQGNVIGHLNEDGTITSNGEILIEGVNVDDLQTVTHYKTQDGQDYIVSEDNTAMDADGNVVGQFNPETGEIISDNGDVVVDVDGTSSDEGEGGNGEGGNNESGNGDSGNGNGNGNQTGTSSASNGNGNQTNTSSSSNGNNNTPTSSEVVTHQTLGDVTIDGAAVQTAQKKSAISKLTVTGLSSENDVTRLSWNLYWLEVKFNNGTYTIEGTVPDHFNDGSYSEFFKFDGHDFEFKLTVGAGSNNQNQGTSSSSKQQQTQTSSSKQQQTQSSTSQQTSGCPTIKYVNGGKSGSGWATRYWDGCKPHCSWPEHANGNYSRQCTNKGKTEDTNYAGNKSVCDGQGTAMACTSQIPFTVNGCTSMGFAFAAVPGDAGPSCGKCYELTFTGEGKYETKPNHQAIRGKKLIIMATNIGYDVSNNGQFDIMIPGGGPGQFNKTDLYGWGSQGETYGGLLSVCENEVGWDENGMLERRKNCLIKKCEGAFGGDTEAIQGCKFLANFMEAAGNPLHNYKEIECPSVLSAKY